jgi:hypothetical protein
MSAEKSNQAYTYCGHIQLQDEGTLLSTTDPCLNVMTHNLAAMPHCGINYSAIKSLFLSSPHSSSAAPIHSFFLSHALVSTHAMYSRSVIYCTLAYSTRMPPIQSRYLARRQDFHLMKIYPRIQNLYIKAA